MLTDCLKTSKGYSKKEEVQPETIAPMTLFKAESPPCFDKNDLICRFIDSFGKNRMSESVFPFQKERIPSVLIMEVAHWRIEP